MRVYVRKTDAVLRAAEDAFVRHGYENTSMDAIAEMAAVSKRTIYNSFKTKYDLYAAVIRKRTDHLFPKAFEDAELVERDVEDVLVEMSRAFLEAILAESEIELYKTVVADARRFPEIGASLLDGPIARSHRAFDEYLRDRVRAGRLRFLDVELAASQLIALLKTDLHVIMTMSQPERVGEKRIAQIAESCVYIFLNGSLVR